MLLKETINKSISAIKSHRRAEEKKQSIDTYLKALRLLSQVKSSIDSSMACAEELRRLGIVDYPIITSDLRDELLEQANNCGKNISEGDLSIEMVKLLQAKGEHLQKQMESAWVIGSRTYSEETISYLSIVGDFSNNPRNAKNIIDQVKRLQDGMPSKRAAQQLVGDINEAKKITEEFTLTPNIEKFLKKVTSQQATILDLTPEVMEWLKKQKLQSKLKIRV